MPRKPPKRAYRHHDDDDRLLNKFVTFRNFSKAAHRDEGRPLREAAIRRGAKIMNLDPDNPDDRDYLLGIMAHGNFPDDTYIIQEASTRRTRARRGPPSKWSPGRLLRLALHLSELAESGASLDNHQDTARLLMKQFPGYYNDINSVDALAKYLRRKFPVPKSGE